MEAGRPGRKRSAEEPGRKWEQSEVSQGQEEWKLEKERDKGMSSKISRELRKQLGRGGDRRAMEDKARFLARGICLSSL